MARTLLGHESVMLRPARQETFAAALAFVAAVAGCGAVASSPDEATEPRLEERVTTTPHMWANPEAPAAVCEQPTPLAVHHDTAGRVDRLHARLTARGTLGSFLVDTGSLKSFATHSGDEERPSASTVISCTETTLPIIARLRPGTTPDGQPQAGVLGADLVAHGAVLDLDLVNGKLALYAPAPKAPAGAVAVPIEVRKGWLVASGIRVNGRDVKLVVDTGASNVILVDKTPRPNEVREETVDGTASAITLFHAEGAIAFPDGVVRRVPVDRTDSFATLEGLIEMLGGDVAGLLGMTSLGRDRVILGHDSLVLVLPPVAPGPL